MAELVDIRKAMVAGVPLKGVEIRRLPAVEDMRGANIVLYEDDRFDRFSGVTFVQDNLSVSRYNVLRGIHGDYVTHKAITCITGSVYFVVVVCCPRSTLLVDHRMEDDFGAWTAFELSDENRYQVYVPPGYGNAHYVQSAFALFHYKLSSPYDLSSQFTIRWDDPTFGVAWPCKDPILSERDRKEGDYDRRVV